MWLREWLKKQYKPSAEVLEEYGPWKRPDELIAREHYVSHHVHHSIYEVGNTPIHQLKEFGQGHLLYFWFLRLNAIMFGCLAVLPAFVEVMLNLLGGYFQSADLQRTTLGNYGLLSFNGRGIGSAADDIAVANITNTGQRDAATELLVSRAFMADVNRTSARFSIGWEKRDTLMALSMLDLVGCLAYFCFSLFMVWFMRRLAALAEEDTVTMRDYSVLLRGLPQDTTEQEIAQAMEVYGDVAMVELARSCGALMELVTRRGEAIRHLHLAKAVLQRHAEVFPRVDRNLEVNVAEARLDVHELVQQIRIEQDEHGDNNVVGAFVTFKEEDAKRRCLEANPTSLFKRLQQQQQQAKGQGPASMRVTLRRAPKHAAPPLDPIRVAVAPEPEDVIFENLEFSGMQRFFRMVLTALLKGGVLLLGFVLISLAPSVRLGVVGNTLGSASSSETCRTCGYLDAAGNFRLNATQRVLYAQCYKTEVYDNKLQCNDEKQCYECFCKGAMNAGVYKESSYCHPFSNILAASTLSQALAVMGIVVVNLAIQEAIEWLAGLEKHQTRSALAQSIAASLFRTQFVNTAFSSLLANAYLPGPKNAVSGSFLKGVVFTGIYPDLTPNWYTDVGRPLMISMMVALTIRLLTLAARAGLHAYAMRHRYQSLTQHELNAAFEGHDFTLAKRYGYHLHMVFVTLTYSAGLPFLYWVAAASFILSYWTEKYELLAMARRPLHVSSDLATYSATTMPFAALWHMAFALWMFSLFGNKPSPIITRSFYHFMRSMMAAPRVLWRGTLQMTSAAVAGRLTQTNTAPHLLLFVACVIALALFFSVRVWIQWVKAGLAAAGWYHEEVRVIGAPEYPVAVRSHLLVGPASYDMRDLQAYEHAFVSMGDGDEEGEEGAGGLDGLRRKAQQLGDVASGPAKVAQAIARLERERQRQKAKHRQRERAELRAQRQRRHGGDDGAGPPSEGPGEQARPAERLALGPRARANLPLKLTNRVVPEPMSPTSAADRTAGWVAEDGGTSPKRAKSKGGKKGRKKRGGEGKEEGGGKAEDGGKTSRKVSKGQDVELFNLTKPAKVATNESP